MQSQDALPSVFGTVSFKTFSLGERHPQIKEIGVAHGKQNQQLGRLNCLFSLTSRNSQDRGLLNCCFSVLVVPVGFHSLGLVCLVWLSLKLERTGPRYDGLELDLKIIWNCNADIVVDVQGIEIGIENVHIDGVLADLSSCHARRALVCRVPGSAPSAG